MLAMSRSKIRTSSLFLLISPANIFFATIVLYGVPACYMSVWGGGLVQAYTNGYKLVHPIEVLILVSCVLAVLSFCVINAPTMSLKVDARFSPTGWRFLFFSWVLALLYACWVLIMELRLDEVVLAMLGRSPDYVTLQAAVGVKLAGGGLLRFYFISYFFPVIWFFCFKVNRRLIGGVIFWLSYFSIVFFFFVLSRRELIIYALMILLLGFFPNISRAKFFGLLLMAMSVMFFMVGVRVGFGGDFSIVKYFAGEEFYPFQLGVFLLDHWLSNPTVRNLVAISPFAIFSKDGSTISPLVMNEYFGYLGPGPTVSIIYTVVAYGFAIPILYFLFVSLLTKTLHLMSARESGWYLIPLYCYMLLKFFLLVRNGELFNSMMDMVLFFCLYVPFVFFRPHIKRV